MSDMIKQIQNSHYALKYVNYRLRKQTHNELYEGYMRSDFSAKKVPECDSIKLVRME